MKKAVALLMTFLLTASMAVMASATTFSDLSKEHWAYNNVMTLLNEGTVNGYEDGTFRPSKTVTRAEFVKMIGKWNVQYDGRFSDLPAEHWGYDYLMWSGLEAVNDKIYPDKKMLRSDVINLIWKRNGSPAHNGAPSVISKQGTNQDATSWAYTLGLVQGDDGLNLRLDRALTRAEAATLILRARKIAAENRQYDFKNVVSEKLLKQIYDSTGIFENVAYEADKTITNAEIARATMVLAAGGKSVMYEISSFDAQDMFEHTYTKDLRVLANKLWGDEYYTPEMADMPATVQDTLSAMIYGLVRRSGRTVKLKNTNTYYSDCVGADSTDMENLCLSYAADNGIKLYAGGNLVATKAATMKDVAAILLQLNDVAGLELSFDSKKLKYNEKVNTDMASYPANYADYRAILDNIPTSLYNLKAETTKPSSYYRLAMECASVFTGFLNSVETLVRTTCDTQIKFTFYPSLTYEEGKRVVFITKCILSGGEEKNVDTIFTGLLKDDTGMNILPGEEYYVVFETYEPLMDLYLPVEGAYIKSIIKPN